MGGICPGGTKGKSRKLEGQTATSGLSGKLKSVNSIGKRKGNSGSHGNQDGFDKTEQRNGSRDLRMSFSPPTPARAAAAKVSQKSSVLGRAGTVGLERAVEVLDILGSGMSSLNAGNSFISGLAPRGNRISILAFEVANTIVKGAILLQSLSEENIQFLKKDVFYSTGVRKLVSTDIKELLRIVAAEKRDELDVFSQEVIRFGDLCRDPQWHNLGRYFSRLDSDDSIHKLPRTEAETAMQELTALAQHTAELYHELNACDRFEQDYKRKLEEVKSLNLPRRGENVIILQSELKEQRKVVSSLKKKSLWSRTLEEIVEKLVDIITYMHQAIFEAFGNVVQKKSSEGQRLGPAGLALHYANVINQIDSIASRPGSLPPNVRNTLYNGLPSSVKIALRSRLQSIDAKEELSIPQVKDEMEKILQWLVPLASNTTKAHQGFGWVGEWANTCHDFSNDAAKNNITRLQTLHLADKQKTDVYILELVAWLHHLVILTKQRDHGFKPHPGRSPTRKGLAFLSKMQQLPSFNYSTKTQKIALCQEDKILLDKLSGRRLVPGISKSQEFAMGKKKGNKVWALSRSTGNSPDRDLGPRQVLEHPKTKLLDLMDGLDPTFREPP